jgi:hypothetical protein
VGKVLVYVTKYALTKGIIVVELIKGDDERMVTVKWKEGGYPAYFHKPDWHLTREEAVSRAKAMKANKLESLKEQIKKLEKREF